MKIIKSKKADLPMWLVGLILALLLMLILIFIIAKTADFNSGFIGWLRDTI